MPSPGYHAGAECVARSYAAPSPPPAAAGAARTCAAVDLRRDVGPRSAPRAEKVPRARRCDEPHALLAHAPSSSRRGCSTCATRTCPTKDSVRGNLRASAHDCRRAVTGTCARRSASYRRHAPNPRLDAARGRHGGTHRGCGGDGAEEHKQDAQRRHGGDTHRRASAAAAGALERRTSRAATATERSWAQARRDSEGGGTERVKVARSSASARAARGGCSQEQQHIPGRRYARSTTGAAGLYPADNFDPI
jgi:hypothetical protein